MEDNKLAKVLVVDDEPNIVELLTVSLKFQNFDVYSASSGNEALRVAREINPDAYILDVMMPGMDGLEATRLIRRLDRPDRCAVPIVALTANADPEDAKQYLSIGMAAVVEKPIKPERLRMAMNAAMSASQAGSQGDPKAQPGRAVA